MPSPSTDGLMTTLLKSTSFCGGKSWITWAGGNRSSAGRSQRELLQQLHLDNNRSPGNARGVVYRSPAHGRQHCPAREETCHACGKKGHFKIMCCTQGAVQAVESAESAADDEAFMGMVRQSQFSANSIYSRTLHFSSEDHSFLF